jgi:hypothetical protein
MASASYSAAWAGRSVRFNGPCRRAGVVADRYELVDQVLGRGLRLRQRTEPLRKRHRAVRRSLRATLRIPVHSAPISRSQS